MTLHDIYFLHFQNIANIANEFNIKVRYQQCAISQNTETMQLLHNCNTTLLNTWLSIYVSVTKATVEEVRVRRLIKVKG